MRSRDAKSTLLNEHLRIVGRDVFLYGENPYEMNRRGSNRLVFRYFSLWVPNGLILDYIKTLQHVTPTTEEVFYSKARNIKDNDSSPFLNGDRYMFVKKPVLTHYSQTQ